MIELYVPYFCLFSQIGEGSCAHRENRKSEWEPVSHVLQAETPMLESLCDIIAIYALQSNFRVNVVSSIHHRLWVWIAHSPYGRPYHIKVPNKNYVLESSSAPGEDCVLQNIGNFSLDCLPYFATIEDMRRLDYKYTNNWLKLKENWAYQPTKELHFTYYHDFECNERIDNDIVLFDLSILSELGSRRIYRRTTWR